MATVTIQVKGAAEVVKKLREKADLSKIRQIVALNGAELQQKAMKKANFKGHWEWKRGEGKVFVPPTGQLHDSIRLKLSLNGMTAIVSANTEYAAYVEYGTRKMAAQPFLRPSLNTQGKKFIRDLKRLAKE